MMRDGWGMWADHTPQPSLLQISNLTERPAMTSRRMVRLIALMAASIISLVEIIHFLADDPERFREVYGGAVQVAHPEQWLLASDASIDPISTRLEFWGDEYGGSKTEFLHGSVSMNALRSLSKSLPPNTKMTGMLQSFRGGQGADEVVKMQARRELTNLPDNSFSTAIIELANPLDEWKLSTTFAGSIDTKTDTSFLFLSGLQEGMRKPIFWRPCTIYRSAECEQKSSLELYRRWVSRLSWLDGIGLAQLDLDINRLRDAAREGRAYGLLTNGYPKPRLLEMLDIPAVRTIRIVETRAIG
ncbi:hypothetical protein [Nonomuraea sp. NPDC049141]|uniref:hypothetical protein n=1 Tax=unclassified Nonomuraea TaxID=2593643 RepID=UPI0033CB211E